MAYKPDQGRLARMSAFWGLWLFLFYGCVSLRYWMQGWPFLPASFSVVYTELPLIGEVTVVSVFCLVVVPAALAVALVRILNRPKVADFLIETEQELRKVHWPSFDETKTASIVVVVCVLVIAAFLAGADAVLGKFFTQIFG